MQRGAKVKATTAALHTFLWRFPRGYAAEPVGIRAIRKLTQDDTALAITYALAGAVALTHSECAGQVVRPGTEPAGSTPTDGALLA
jgi:hypothetical protein